MIVTWLIIFVIFYLVIGTGMYLGLCIVVAIEGKPEDFFEAWPLIRGFFLCLIMWPLPISEVLWNRFR